MWPRMPREEMRLLVGLVLVSTVRTGVFESRCFRNLLESVDAAVSCWATHAAADVAADSLFALERSEVDDDEL